MEFSSAQLEQLVWQDLQEDDLSAYCGFCDSDSQQLTDSVAAISSQMSDPDSPVAYSTDDRHATPTISPVLNSAHDAVDTHATSGEVCAVAGGTVPDAGPFASQQHHKLLSTTPSGCLTPHETNCANVSASLQKYRSRALAAAAGSCRLGSVGSSLRLAAFVSRSNSSGLADSLLAERVRTESGLLTAGLQRCDSLPELCPAASVDICDVFSVRDLDLFASMPPGGSFSFLGSVTLTEPQQQAAPACTSQQQSSFAAATNTATAPILHQPDLLPWLANDPVCSRPVSCAGGPPAQAPSLGAVLADRPQLLPALQPPRLLNTCNGTSSLRPPELLTHAQMAQHDLLPPPAMQPTAAEPGTGLHVQLQGVGGSHAAPAVIEDTLALPPEPRSHCSFTKLLANRQEAINTLMRRVDQELCAEAEVRQYAALEICTMPLSNSSPHAHTAHVTSPFTNAHAVNAAATAAVIPAVLHAAAQSEEQRRSVFAGQTPSLLQATAMPQPVSAAAGPMRPLDACTSSLATWTPPVQLPNSTAAAAGAAAGVAAGGCSVGTTAVLAAAGAGSAAVASPFVLPQLPSPWVNPGLSAPEAGCAAPGVLVPGVPNPETTLGASRKQQVARYSRVITCKTYLKRLNITQPMAEHLLPLHNLTGTSHPAKSPSKCDASDDDECERKTGSRYEQLFKDHIVIVDEAGARFKVQYEGVSCNAQKHLRLTSGWRDFVRLHNVEVGDAITFERRGENRSTLYVTLVRARDGPVNLQPEPKRRRAGRKDRT